MTAKDFPPLTPKIVLGVAAHPDDIDFGAGGTLAGFARSGAEVHILVITDGSKGAPDRTMSEAELVKLRQQEQTDAAKAIGAVRVQFLTYIDGELELSPALKQDIARVICELKPDVVVTIDPTVIYNAPMGIINHSDHRAVGQATLDAIYPLARDNLSLPELRRGGLEPFEVSTVLLINFGTNNFYVDIGDTLQVKMDAMKAHASQIDDLKSVQQLFTDIAADAGERAGCQYAEGFVRIDVRSVY